jgi:hypothetical protein
MHYNYDTAALTGVRAYPQNGWGGNGSVLAQDELQSRSPEQPLGDERGMRV